MDRESRINLPNALSGFRILAAPVLWVLIYMDAEPVFKWLLTAAFFTDLIDGYLARALNQVTRFGSLLDSIGDSLTVITGVIGLIRFRYELFVSYQEIIWVVIGLHLIQLLCALLRYHRPSSFHTWSAKVAEFGIATLILVTFHLDFYPAIFWFAMVLLVIDALEETVLVFLLPQWTTDVKGLWWVLKTRN